MNRLSSLLVIVLFTLSSPSLAAPGRDVIEQIDAVYNLGHPKMHMPQGMAQVKQSLDLTSAALEQEPESYELLWRYVRGCAQYSESLCLQRWDIPDWDRRSAAWSKRGLEMAPKAQVAAPERPEAYFWRTVCMGKYIDSMGGYNTIKGVMAAIRQGALPKTKADIAKAYAADPTYLHYMPTQAQFQALSRMPTFVAPRDQWQLAFGYFKEWHAGIGHFSNAHEPVAEACVAGEYLIRAVQKQCKSGMSSAEAEHYRDYAKEMLSYAAASDVRYYREWAQGVLDEYWP